MDKSTAPAAPNSIHTAAGEIGKRSVGAMVAVQAELFEELQEMSQYWAARAKSEADLAAELVSKLTSAHSAPEAATAYQEWARQRMQMAVEDGQRLFADSLKFMEKSARLFSSGGAGSGS